MRLAVIVLLASILAGCAMEPVSPSEPPASSPTATPATRPPTPLQPTPPPTPPTPTFLATHFSESFDSGLASWTIERGDARTDCTTAYADCSLRVRPPCCGFPYSDVYRTVDVELPAVLSVRFLATSLRSDHDQHLELFFGSGAQYVFDITHGQTSDNNGVNLRGPGGAETGVLARLPNANEWYEATLTLDNERSRIVVLVRDADGKPLGSRSIALPAGETHVSWLRFRSVDYNPSGVDYHWDELRLEPLSPELSVGESWEDGFSDWTVENDSASISCGLATAGCALNVTPACCDRYVDVSRVVHVPLPANVSVKFLGTSTTGSLDANFEFFTSRSTQYVFDITSGDNNGVRFLSTSGSTGDLLRWNRTGEWYTANFNMDPERGLVTVTILDPDGLTLASGQRPLPRGEDALAWLRFRAAEYSTPGGSAFLWDDVRIEAR